MTLSTALMISITLILPVAMVPKIYFTWLISGELFMEGEVASLRLLVREENRWVRRHFCFGTLVTFLVWLLKHSPIELPDGTSAVMAGYAVISMILAVVESLLAQHIDVLSTSIPAPVGLEKEDE